MKITSFISLLLSLSTVTISHAQWTSKDAQQCRDSFKRYIPQTASLKFVCTDPSTQGTRSDFIALQYSETKYLENEEEIYLQYNVICSSTGFADSVSQDNSLITGVGLLYLIGDDGNKTKLNRLSSLNRKTLEGLSSDNCTDGFGNRLID